MRRELSAPTRLALLENDYERLESDVEKLDERVDRRLTAIVARVDEVVVKVEHLAGRLTAIALLGSVAGGAIAGGLVKLVFA
jgi:hypothetical protein